MSLEYNLDSAAQNLMQE